MTPNPTQPPEDPSRTAELLTALEVYRTARRDLLAVLRLPLSNRDPLAEFSEHLVHAVYGGVLASSRVQAGHDLVLLDGRKVQVRYLANTHDKWVNEHLVYAIPGVKLYALVLYQAFQVIGVVVFDVDRLADVCALLGKRHPLQDQQLQFTARNWRAIRDDPQRFAQASVMVWTPPAPG